MAGGAAGVTSLHVATDNLGSDAAYCTEDLVATSSNEDAQSSGGNAMPQTFPATSNSSPI